MFAHISDTHLGAAPYGLREREEDFYRVFREAVSVIVKDHVRVVVHSGDLLDEPRLPGRPILELVQAARRLRDSGARLYLVLGEHDFRRVQGEVPIPRTLEELGLAVILRDEEIVRDESGLLLAGFLKKRREEIYKGGRPLVDRLRAVAERIRGDSGRKVLVLHQGLTEFHRHAGEMSAHDLPSGFDYYAMGHLHDRAVKRFSWLTGPVVYPGSTETTGSEQIPETGIEKGFFLVDASGDEPRLEWVKLSARPHYRVESDVRELDQKLLAVEERLRREKLKPVLYLLVRGESVEGRLVEKKLARISSLVLTYRLRVERVEKRLPRAPSPSLVEEQLYRLAARALGSREKAERAVRELLPLLASGRIEEAAEKLAGWAKV